MRRLIATVFNYCRIGTLGLSIALVLAIGSAAHASQRIRYEGETSAGRRITIGVVKRDSGRRFLRTVKIGVEVACEDGTTESFRLSTRFDSRTCAWTETGRSSTRTRPPPSHSARPSSTSMAPSDGGPAPGRSSTTSAGLTDDGQDAQLSRAGISRGRWSACRYRRVAREVGVLRRVWLHRVNVVVLAGTALRRRSGPAPVASGDEVTDTAQCDSGESHGGAMIKRGTCDCAHEWTKVGFSGVDLHDYRCTRVGSTSGVRADRREQDWTPLSLAGSRSHSSRCSLAGLHV